MDRQGRVHVLNFTVLSFLKRRKSFHDSFHFSFFICFGRIIPFQRVSTKNFRFVLMVSKNAHIQIPHFKHRNFGESISKFIFDLMPRRFISSLPRFDRICISRWITSGCKPSTDKITAPPRLPAISIRNFTLIDGEVN